jgi:hypothetical protein
MFLETKSNTAAKFLPGDLAYYQHRSDYYTTAKMSVDDTHCRYRSGKLSTYCCLPA